MKKSPSSILRWSVLTTALIITSVSAAFADARSKLEISETAYSFGTIQEGQKVTHDFEIKNTGDAALQIQRIAPSCGCTVATVENGGAVAAGQSTKIHVEFDSSGFTGDKTKTVQVFTSDLDEPQVTLTLKGSILPGATMEPSRLDFGELNPGMADSDWSKEFSVSVSSPEGLKVGDVRSLSKYVSVVDLGKSHYKVTIDRSIPRGTLRERVLVDLAGTKPSTLNMPLVGFVRGDIRVEPSTLSFGIIEGKSTIERRIKFENSGKDPVKILSAISSSPAVKIEVKEIQPGRSYVLVANLDPEKVTRELRASIDIETDHSEEKQLSVSVFGVTPPNS